MQSRHTSRLLTLLCTAATLPILALSTASPAASATPASVAIESAGIARETGCAVIHVATSQPTQVRLERALGRARLVADFLDAVLAPNAAGAIQQTPPLRDAVTIRQASSKPPVVRLEVVSLAGAAPTAQRFADSRGLLVKLQLEEPPNGGPRTARPSPSLVSDARIAAIRLASATLPPPLIAPISGMVGRSGTELGMGAAPQPERDSPRSAVPSGGQPPLATFVVRETDGGAPAVQPPQPHADAAELQQVRVVGVDPLRVAIDCSRPLRYRLEELESPRRYVLTFPGAAIGRDCLQAVALHPAQPGAVTISQGTVGAQVTIPATDGHLCSPKPGASPRTVVCELAPPEGALLAQRPAPAGGEPGAATSPAPDADNLLINVDFQSAPVVEILTALAKYADRNIITTPSVQGNMSVHLTRVTLAEALDLVAALNSLDYTLVGERNYIVGTAEEIARVRGVEATLPIELIYKPENTTPYRIAQELREVVEQLGVTIKIVEDAQSVVFMNLPDERSTEWLRERAAQVDVPPIDTTRWIQLEHLTAAQAASALEGLTPNVEVQVPGPEAPQVAVISLSGKSVDVDKAEQVLASIDVEPTISPGAVGDVVTRSLRVTYVDPEAFIELVTSMFAGQAEAYLATPPTELRDVQGSEKVGGIRPSAQVVVRGPESAVAAVEELLAQIDVPPPQVEITATITDVGVDKDQKVGFEWDLPGLIVSEEMTAGDGFKFGKISRAPFNSGGSGSFTASFEAMVTGSSATILSRTKLVAVNGKSANFLVGEIIPYEIAVAGDGTIKSSVEFQEIGLGLKFGPNVDANEEITLFLAPHVRSFSGYSPQGYPVVVTREAETIVRVSDGDVIAIGGLLRDEEVKTLSGIPFLKDIPLFGELFKKRQTQRRKSEVVVFAEVKLLRPGAAPVSAEAPAVGEG